MSKRVLGILVIVGLVMLWSGGGAGSLVMAQGEDPETTPAEEPVVEEAIEEPVVEEAIEEPVVEEAIEEPVVEEVIEEPVAEEATEESAAEEGNVEPVVEEPAVEEPAAAPPVAAPPVDAGVSANAIVNPPGQTSHVLLQNTSASAAAVTVNVYKTDGSVIYGPTSFNIAGDGARTLHANTGTDSTGHLYMNLSEAQSAMQVESDQRLVATNVTAGGGTVHNIYEGQDSSNIATDILLPSIHWRDAQWSLTGIQNAGSADATLTIKYFKQDGTQMGADITHPGLKPGASHFRNAHTDVSIATYPDGVGSMRVTSGQPLAIAVEETLNTYTTSYIGIPETAKDTMWVFPSVHLNPAGQYTHILVQNTGAALVNFTLKYYNQAGAETDSFIGSIPDKGALTFHTTTALSDDGNSYRPTGWTDVVGSATVAVTGGNVVATVVETVGAAPYAYNGFNTTGGAAAQQWPSLHQNPAGQYSHTLVQNLSSTQDAVVTFTYYKQDGTTTAALQTTETIAKSGSMTFHTSVGTDSPGHVYLGAGLLGNVGSAKATSTGGTIVSVAVETIAAVPGAYAGFQ